MPNLLCVRRVVMVMYDMATPLLQRNFIGEGKKAVTRTVFLEKIKFEDKQYVGRLTACCLGVVAKFYLLMMGMMLLLSLHYFFTVVIVIIAVNPTQNVMAMSAAAFALSPSLAASDDPNNSAIVDDGGKNIEWTDDWMLRFGGVARYVLDYYMLLMAATNFSRHFVWAYI